MNFESFTKSRHLTSLQMKTVYALAPFAKIPKLKFLKMVKELNPDNREPCNGVPPVLKFPKELENCSELCCSAVTIKHLKSLLQLKEFKKTELWDIWCAFKNNNVTFTPLTFNYGEQIFVMFTIDFTQPYDAYISLKINRHTNLYFQPINLYLGECLETDYDN